MYVHCIYILVYIHFVFVTGGCRVNPFHPVVTLQGEIVRNVVSLAV